MQTYYLALDLKNDPKLIKEYEDYHKAVWPEILQSLDLAGILSLDIYRIGNRLFMIIKTNNDFSFDKKSKMDHANPKVQEWEELMWKYQQALPWAKEGEKWMLMENIFSFESLG